MLIFAAPLASYAPEERMTALETEIVAAINSNNHAKLKDRIDYLAKDISSRATNTDPYYQAVFSVIVSLVRHNKTPDPSCMADFLDLNFEKITGNVIPSEIIILQSRVERWSEDFPQTKLARVADKLYLTAIQKTDNSKEFVQRALVQIRRKPQRYLDNPGALKSLFTSSKLAREKKGQLWVELLALPPKDLLENDVFQKIHDVLPLENANFEHLDKTEMDGINSRVTALEEEIERRISMPEHQTKKDLLIRQLNTLGRIRTVAASTTNFDPVSAICGVGWDMVRRLLPLF